MLYTFLEYSPNISQVHYQTINTQDEFFDLFYNIRMLLHSKDYFQTDCMIIRFSLHVKIDVTQVVLLIASQQAYLFKRPAKEGNFLSKNEETLVISDFKKALKKVTLIRKVISSCFAAYGIIFCKKVEESDLFVDLFCFSLLKLYMEYIFRVPPMIFQ